jgi:alpha-glucosidase
MTGARLTGPGLFNRKFQINQIPVYIKAGTILPEEPEMRYTGEKPVDPLIFEVLPFAEGQKDSEYSVYEDSDIAERYQQGEFARTPVRVTRTSPDEYLVQIGGAHGTYQGMPKSRAYELHFDGVTQPTQVTADGRRLKAWKLVAQDAGWRFDREKNQLTVRIASGAVEQTRVVRITFSK